MADRVESVLSVLLPGHEMVWHGTVPCIRQEPQRHIEQAKHAHSMPSTMLDSRSSSVLEMTCTCAPVSTLALKIWLLTFNLKTIHCLHLRFAYLNLNLMKSYQQEHSLSLTTIVWIWRLFVCMQNSESSFVAACPFILTLSVWFDFCWHSIAKWFNLGQFLQVFP